MQGKILEELEKKVNRKKLKYNDIIQVLRDTDSIKEKIDERRFKEEYLNKT